MSPRDDLEQLLELGAEIRAFGDEVDPKLALAKLGKWIEVAERLQEALKDELEDRRRRGPSTWPPLQ